jgi:hypothetical protein
MLDESNQHGYHSLTSAAAQPPGFSWAMQSLVHVNR